MKRQNGSTIAHVLVLYTVYIVENNNVDSESQHRQAYAENSGDNSLQNSFGCQSLHICTQTHLPSFFALINKASCVS